MTAPARLLSVRLQGFKSFAERTHVSFGPGISAVVGPNGSGKSNLADALRWALGEQGRALRTRKSEDVIWAGSDRRPALGMADVQLVLDNDDGLLPVEFGVVELGRRLFRSGENEYVLNRQRVRLRDLVDLLDSAHLAENAFLFIGQGMVDQALALRPEERRPLFEEVAGVRRHERRRRKAEEQLLESQANLSRVEDVVGELRPQVRRLAAQAEQQASRRDAGAELADALLAAAHLRWNAAAGRLAAAAAALEAARAGVEVAMAELAVREEAAATLSERLTASAAAVDAARRIADGARDALTAARLAAARADAEADEVARDRGRLDTERTGIEARLETDRRTAATTLVSIDPALEHELRSAEAALAEAARELAEARASTSAAAADRDAARRAEAARSADLELARRRQAELARDLTDEGGRAQQALDARDVAAREHAATISARAAALEAEAQSARDEAAATAALAAELEARQSAVAKHVDVTSRLTSARDRLVALQASIEAVERDGLGSRARAAGARRVDDGLVLRHELRPAVSAALGEIASGFVVTTAVVATLAAERGSVVVKEGLDAAPPDDVAAVDTRMAALVRAAGGGPLGVAVERDPTAAVRALLARCAWLPDLDAALRLRRDLAPGWLLVALDGSAVVTPTSVSFGRGSDLLDRRAEADKMAADVRALGLAATTATEARAAADARAAAATVAHDTARRDLAAAVDVRRAADAAEAAAGRRAEAAAREAAWLEAQLARVEASLERATQTLASLEGSNDSAPSNGSKDSAARPADPSHLASLERRVQELRATRDRLDQAWREAEAERRDRERERARAEAGVEMAERRRTDIESTLAVLSARAGEAGRACQQAAAALEGALAAAAEAGTSLEQAVAADAAERQALGGAERAAAAAREGLQRVQDRSRAAEREELEARLGLESLREQLLVELAGLGELGLRHLQRRASTATVDAATDPVRPDQRAAAAHRDAGAAPGDGAAAPGDGADEPSADVAELEAALQAVSGAWAAEPPPADAPSSGRLAALRRRFHELGAANPYALEEHAAMAARLEGLEGQRSDLVAAVEKTRSMISELDALIAGQFRATFAALETAFDARFRQLFGGGFARLALTEPGDLAATGIEITARPPGKKPQALAMLSGGERALTAVALLFAMLEIRPVPFCVLDEVDAALDEANVGRFTDALRELAATTQFIVITHNRGTIETADALYGVTVGDDSVSRVISLRLEEATALASTTTRRPAGRDVASTTRGAIIPAGLTAEDLAAESIPLEVTPEAVRIDALETGGS